MLAELGVEQVFHKIALRPGKPLWFGVKHDGDRRVLVFGLPGNPVSSLVCFELFVRPAIAALAGRGFRQLSAVRAKLTHAYDHAGGRAACLPALLSGSGSSFSVEILPGRARPTWRRSPEPTVWSACPPKNSGSQPAHFLRFCRCKRSNERPFWPSCELEAGLATGP